MVKKVTANLVGKSSSQERANGSSRVELPSIIDPWNDLAYVYPDTLFDCPCSAALALPYTCCTPDVCSLHLFNADLPQKTWWWGMRLQEVGEERNYT